MEKSYRTMNEHITPHPGLSRRVLERTVPRRRGYLRPAAALALVLVLMLSAPRALANPDIYQLLHSLSPETAARFAPVQESCEANGVRFQVVAASVHGKSAEIYLEMTDLGGGLIQEGSYPEVSQIIGLENYGLSLKLLDYDPRTGCTTMMLDYETIDGDFADRFPWGKITLYLDRITTGTGAAEYSMQLLPTGNETISIAMRRVNADGSLSDDGNEVYDLTGYSGAYSTMDVIELLSPGAAGQEIADGIWVTGIGFVGDRLHVQTRDAYEMYLTNAAGEIVRPEGFLSFAGENAAYTDYVFKVDPQALEAYTLVIRVEDYAVTEGPWRITFDLDEVRSSYHDPDDDVEKVTTPPV